MSLVEKSVTIMLTGIPFLFLFVALTGYASNIQLDGQTYPMPQTVTTEPGPISLNKSAIQQLAQKTTLIKPLTVGFKPLTTTAMHVCRQFKSKRTNITHLLAPVFIVGDDPTSLHWVQTYKTTLNKIHAIGLVVSVKSISALSNIKNRVGNVSLYPAEGKAVSHFFGVQCYPVLVSKHLIEQ